MPSLPPFDRPGLWLRGNLHTHTTNSDGKVSLETAARWFADHGYDFLAITDHNRVTPIPADGAPLILFSGAEITAHRNGVDYHVLAIGVDGAPLPYHADPQKTIKAINAAGGLAIIAHPYWHDHTLNDLLPLEGHAGIEIFNSGCWLELQKGHSLVHWDLLLRRGQRIWGFAADDSHWGYPDYGLGWVVVKAAAREPAAILAALRAGEFYCSMGPQIHDVALDERLVTVRCSPARAVYVTGDYNHCPNAIQARNGPSLTAVTVRLHPQQVYFRVEVVDAAGRSAWTQPVWVAPAGG